ncbi:uncharacterized protein LOC115254615 [Aedes albopictus]|uniref:DDE Tnp4 domain-containing protein n=1 Tax=Aedes albopictus TaxID=7160 RepID=A0ABM1Y9X0_AEDAL
MHIGTNLNNTPSGIRCCCSDQNCEVAKQSKTSIETLNKKISHLTEQLKMNARDLEFISVSDDKCLYYTGISSFKTVQHLFNYLKDNISQPHCNFTKEQVFVMTLTKLRLNHQFQTLAYDYKVCPNTISKYFHRTLEIIDRCLGYALEMPDKNVLSNHTPKRFKDQFGDRRILIIDCFEVRSETPENPKAAVSHFSNYKKSETTKFLISICPDGNIAFISPGYGGRCSDKKIVQDSGILNYIEAGDVIIADKGFDIADLVESKGAILNIPLFLINKRQFRPAEIEKNRQVTKLRIHVERCIAGLKNKFLIISQIIPVGLLVRFENDKNIVDLVARVCCILYNFNPSIIK